MAQVHLNAVMASKEAAQRDRDIYHRERDQLLELLRWALPYVPEPTPSMAGGEFAERYKKAARLLNA